ncbi:MAG: hypothetical protein JHC12_01995 [Thermogladius sp.]|nr:hypothetical protein [Thermogladius sp.]
MVNRRLVSTSLLIAGVLFAAESAWVFYIGFSFLGDILAYVKPYAIYLENLHLLIIVFNLTLSVLSITLGILVRKLDETRLIQLSPVVMAVAVISLFVGGGFMIGAGLSALATSILLSEGVESRLR